MRAESPESHRACKPVAIIRYWPRSLPRWLGMPLRASRVRKFVSDGAAIPPRPLESASVSSCHGADRERRRTTQANRAKRKTAPDAMAIPRSADHPADQQFSLWLG